MRVDKGHSQSQCGWLHIQGLHLKPQGPRSRFRLLQLPGHSVSIPAPELPSPIGFFHGPAPRNRPMRRPATPLRPPCRQRGLLCLRPGDGGGGFAGARASAAPSCWSGAAVVRTALHWAGARLPATRGRGRDPEAACGPLHFPAGPGVPAVW